MKTFPACVTAYIKIAYAPPSITSQKGQFLSGIGSLRNQTKYHSCYGILNMGNVKAI